MSATAVIDITRSMATSLVDRAERQTRSRMTAYADVGRAIGRSSEWLRKFLRGETSQISLPVGLQIIIAYDRLCSRIEQEAAVERAKHLAIKEQLNAATAGTLDVVAVALAAQERGTPGAQEQA